MHLRVYTYVTRIDLLRSETCSLSWNRVHVVHDTFSMLYVLSSTLHLLIFTRLLFTVSVFELEKFFVPRSDAYRIRFQGARKRLFSNEFLLPITGLRGFASTQMEEKARENA